MVALMGVTTHCKHPCSVLRTILPHLLSCCTMIQYSFYLCRYIRPQFFYNNPLLSFIQYVTGPYADDLGNVLPYAVEGVGVPVDPLAFAGLLGRSPRDSNIFIRGGFL